MIDQKNSEKNLNYLGNNYSEKKEKIKYDKKNIEENIIKKLVAIEDSIKAAYSDNDDKGLVLSK